MGLYPANEVGSIACVSLAIVELTARVERRGKAMEAYFVVVADAVGRHWELWKKNEVNSKDLEGPFAVEEYLTRDGYALREGLHLRQTPSPAATYDTGMFLQTLSTPCPTATKRKRKLTLADLCRAHRRRQTCRAWRRCPSSAKIAAREQPPLVLSSHPVGDDNAPLAATATLRLTDNLTLP